MTNFQCAICKMNFTKKSSFHRHNILVHSCRKLNAENSFGCMYCGKRYTAEFSLNEHVQKCHTAASSADKVKMRRRMEDAERKLIPASFFVNPNFFQKCKSINPRENDTVLSQEQVHHRRCDFPSIFYTLF